MKNKVPATDQRELLRKVEELVQQIERSGEEDVPIHAMVEAIVKELRDELGIYGARLYERLGDDYVLRVTFPGGNTVDEVFRVSRKDLAEECGRERVVTFEELVEPTLLKTQHLFPSALDGGVSCFERWLAGHRIFGRVRILGRLRGVGLRNSRGHHS